MILRDPVHGLVAFEGQAEALVLALLATPEMQRMRRVRQLGLASLAFPGAEHSRFSHALGACHVMTRLQLRLDEVSAELAPANRLDADARFEALAAALLHDLGHGPFSHLFELILPQAVRHEAWTQRLLEDPGTEVHRTLAAIRSDLPGVVARLVGGEHRLAYVGQAVAGTLDVDRCDYLLRDSHMTGVGYGTYDLDWLLRALSLVEEPDLTGEGGGGRVVLAVEGRKGLPPIEGFFLARNYMYQQVYHHKAVRAAEALVRGMFLRLVELIRDGVTLSPLPRAIDRAARGEEVSLGDYLALDDHALMAGIHGWRRCGDSVLADLAERFLLRRLPKTLPLPDHTGAEPLWEQALKVASDIALGAGFRPDLHVWLDQASDVPYAEPAPPGKPGLWVSRRHQPLARLGDVSFILRELRNKRICRPRLIFPGEIRAPIRAALESLLR